MEITLNWRQMETWNSNISLIQLIHSHELGLHRWKCLYKTVEPSIICLWVTAHCFGWQTHKDVHVGAINMKKITFLNFFNKTFV